MTGTYEFPEWLGCCFIKNIRVKLAGRTPRLGRSLAITAGVRQAPCMCKQVDCRNLSLVRTSAYGRPDGPSGGALNGHRIQRYALVVGDGIGMVAMIDIGTLCQLTGAHAR